MEQYLCCMSNRLIHEQSPYLLQHAHNPVHWYPWGDEAFMEAERLNKPVLVSIGYAACHWCHVMERESFEDEQVAAYMNTHFVCVKVDREEHPDVDHLYMDAVQAISGSGGWPLNVFTTPLRVPFFGGTYYPSRPAYSRPSWLQVLQRMNEIWEQQPEEIEAQASQMINYLKQASQPLKNTGDPLNNEVCSEIARVLLKSADIEKGGFGNAPKFPGTMAISYLLEHYHYTGSREALKHALKSLDAMIEGGIYDQIGGGLSRYATDADWLIPHFEKMLYDNALLISALCDAYAIAPNERYKGIIDDIIAFANRELRDVSGGYYSSLDADSEGVEGKFYTWTWGEWMDAVGENDEVVQQYFGVTPAGNWEHTNILHVSKSIEELSTSFAIGREEIEQRIHVVKNKLLYSRNKRVRPGTDDKLLLSWNAMMNISLTKAANILGNPAYLQQATEHMHWMLNAFSSGPGLMHTWKGGKARIAAKLDDYASLIQALLQLGSASGENGWVIKAYEFTQAVTQHFSHEGGDFFYFTSNSQEDIPVRKVDQHDGAMPSANSVMAHNLLLLGLAMEHTEWLERAAAMLRSMIGSTVRYAYSFGYWAILLQRYNAGLKTVVAVGDSANAAVQSLRRVLMPNCFLLTSEKEISEIPILRNKHFANKVLIFVCTEEACMPPSGTPEEVLRIVNPNQYLQ